MKGKSHLKENSIVRATQSVMFTLILVKVIGIIKQAVLAAYFGTSFEMDAYLLVSDFVGESGIVIFSSLSVTFLNMYVSTLVHEGKEEKDRFVVTTIASFVPIAFVIMLLLSLFANPIVSLLAPGYTIEQKMIVSGYLRLMSITLVNSCINNIFTAILDSEKVFIPSKISGIIQSGCLIVGCVLFAEKIGIKSLIYAYLGYYAIQNVFLYFFVRKYIKVNLKLRFSWDKRVAKIIRQSGSLFISNAVIQINAIIDKSIASCLSPGNITALSYGYFIFSSLHSIVVGGSSSVIFSHFSDYAANGDFIKIKQLMEKSIHILILILCPITLVLCLNSKEIILLLFGRGAFDLKSVEITANTLVAYSVGLVFLAVRDILIRVHYAYQDTNRPMVNGIICVVCNILLSIILSYKIGSFGIALASSLASGLGALLMFYSVKRIIPEERIEEHLKFIAQVAISGMIALGVSYYSTKIFSCSKIFLILLIRSISLIVTYIFCLYSIKCEEILEIIIKIGRRRTGEK